MVKFLSTMTGFCTASGLWFVGIPIQGASMFGLAVAGFLLTIDDIFMTRL